MEENSKRLEVLNTRIKAMKSMYEARNIPQAIYEASLSDVYYRLERFKNTHGYDGISEWDMFWLEDVLNCKFFNIGVLRFQIFEMKHALIQRKDYDYIELSEDDKRRFPEGQFYLSVHIIQGADLSEDKVDETFDMARQFFKLYFSDYHFEYFICRTWLIDESLNDLLKPDSKILSFAKRFEFVARGLNYSHPFKRIYGTDDLEAIKKLEHKSSLAKEAYKHADRMGVTFASIKF